VIGVDWVAGREGAVAVGDTVEVKFDLSRRNDGVWWAITAKHGAHGGKVVAYARGAAITGVTQHVLAGTQRRWAGQRRKPCAWLVGTLAVVDDVETRASRRVTFPFHSGHPSFIYVDDGTDFTAAPVAVFTNCGAFVAESE
jgi:hypothetical protein